MNCISGESKRIFNASVRFLDQPVVKERVKSIAGTVTFVFGLMEIHDIYQITRGRQISCEACSNHPQWVQIANKVVIICAKISLILSAGISRPGIFIISSLLGCIFFTAQLNSLFGTYAIFAINPWHPRHIVSLAAVIFALPSVAQSACKVTLWAYNKIQQYNNHPVGRLNIKTWLTTSKIRLMTLFNTVTSRPLLHIGNQLFKFSPS